ncbi:MAG: hypothetical protein WB755_17690 [Terriglobales bacterium]
MENPHRVLPHGSFDGFFHANPNKASELGRIGGRRRSSLSVQSTEALAAVETAIDLKNMVARLIADVSTGKLHPRTAAGLVPLLGLQLRTIEIADYDVRLRKLEQGALNRQKDRWTRRRG